MLTVFNITFDRWLILRCPSSLKCVMKACLTFGSLSALRRLPRVFKNLDACSMSWLAKRGALVSVDLVRLCCVAYANASDTSHLWFPQPVSEVKTGKRGRPKKMIDRNFLREALDPQRHIPLAR